MSAAVLRFPRNMHAPELADARAALHSAADHPDDILLIACDALESWGDATDINAARMMRRAIARAAANLARNRAALYGLPPLASSFAPDPLYPDTALYPVHSIQSGARDFGALDRASMDLRRIVWTCAAIAAGLLIGWLFLRGITTALIDAETARAIARAYGEGM